jgi:hypothetical protein
LDPKLHVSTSHNMAIYGESSNNNAHAVVGFATATSGEAYGVYGFATSPSGAAVCGETTTTDCSAIKGLSLGNPGTGGWFKSDAGNGVYAESNSTTSSAIRAVHTSTAPGSAFIPAVYGVHAEADGIGIGVMGRGGYRGVEGIVEQPAGASDYYGVYGYVSGGSGINRGLYGEAQGSFANGADYGVYGTASGSGSGASLGVYGSATGSGYNYGVFGTASGGMTNYAGYFSGNVSVTGTLSKGGGSFKIDHPLDPANKYLYHSFVESPEMMNVYNGNVELDAAGEAVVVLPEWFEALNRDYRYQLTCIGGFAPVYIAQEITGNQFKIAGGRPGLKVSWQVTGVRQDAFANANRIPVEEDKPDDELGTYLHPEAFGMSPELQVDRVREAREQAEVDVVPQDQ